MISSNTTKPPSVVTFIFGATFWLLLAGSARADEIALALVADAYSRTAFSNALIVSKTNGPVPTRGGLNIIPDRQAGAPHGPKRILPPLRGSTPVAEFDRALLAIGVTYGRAAASTVELQLEYSQP